MDELLNQARLAGELRRFDLQLARAIIEANGEDVPELRLAVTLVSYRLSLGDTCIALDKVSDFGIFTHPDIDVELQKVPSVSKWRNVLLNQKVVDSPPQEHAGDDTEPDTSTHAPAQIAPLILNTKNQLYLSRYWYFEQSLVAALGNLVDSPPPAVNSAALTHSLNAIYKTQEAPDWQKVATATAALNRLCVITGGPGTGKTYTVAAVIAVLAAQLDETLNLALAAPTGKAAARLTETLHSSAVVPEPYRDVEAQTLHRLLGLVPGKIHPRFNADNPLPYDVLVVDEASMIDLPMMTRLLEAVADNCRLILLGDKDQLASVESGMVLSDICGGYGETRLSTAASARLSEITGVEVSAAKQKPMALSDHIIYLNKSHRTDDQSGITALAAAINAGDLERCFDLFSSTNYKKLALFKHNPQNIERVLMDSIVPVYKEIDSLSDPLLALQKMSDISVLCALRRGRYGAEGINQQVTSLLREQGIISTDDFQSRGQNRGRNYDANHGHYHCRPLMITENSRSQNLFNGDFGIAWADNESRKVCFPGESGLRYLAPSRLPRHETFYAMTIHKSQGSEYDSVVIILPEEDNPLLTRELLYTAVTRARKNVTVIANKEQLALAVNTRSERQSGIQDVLWPGGSVPVNRSKSMPPVNDVPVQAELDF